MGDKYSEEAGSLVELVEEIRAERKKTNHSKKSVGKLLEQFRDETGFSVNDLCMQLKTTPATYSKWKTGAETLPFHRIDELAKFVSTLSDQGTLVHAVKLPGEARINLRTFNQVLDRMNRCDHVFSCKNQLPYRSGRIGDVQDKMLEMLQDPHGPHYHCIIWKDSGESVSPALDTFRELKRVYEMTLDRADQAVSYKLHGWEVSDPKIAFELGISVNLTSTCVLHYDPAKTEKHKSLAVREADIFIECPHAVYNYMLHSLKSEVWENRWSEIQPDRAKEQLRLMKPHLDQFTKAAELGPESCLSIANPI